MKILIDNGHGQNTPGKRSPDGRFLEYKFNRIIAAAVVADLQDRGYDAELLVPEEDDILLKDRCSRVNEIVSREGKDNVILVSIHANAFGNGNDWTSPSGWSVYTTKGQTKADELAEQLAKAAIKNLPQMKMRADKSDGDSDYEENFYILRHTICPAVLTENGFYTNKEDLAILESREGRRAITDLHVEGIIEYLTK
ncbi:MAG: N-acetylmuramoyl-L-alanine amidase [Candidatus Cryptobacteroides sp.]